MPSTSANHWLTRSEQASINIAQFRFISTHLTSVRSCSACFMRRPSCAVVGRGALVLRSLESQPSRQLGPQAEPSQAESIGIQHQARRQAVRSFVIVTVGLARWHVGTLGTLRTMPFRAEERVEPVRLPM